MSIKINIYNQQAEKVGEKDLEAGVFALKAKEALIHQVLVSDLANSRPVLAHTKDRSEVRGGGRKPWRQKGTGRARAGSSRSPLWRGGGVIFGPLKNRNFKKKINKKMKKKALCMVLSDKVKEGNFIVLEDLNTTEYKTKIMAKILDNLEEKIFNQGRSIEKVSRRKAKKSKQLRSILIIKEKKEEKVFYSLRNLAGVKIINLDNLNIIDLLKYRNVIVTTAVVDRITERYK